MASRRLRITSLFVVLGTALALTGLVAPGASAEVGDIQVEIVNQPTDAAVGELITAEPFDPSGGESGYVQVHVTQTVEVCDPETETCHEENQDLQGASVTFVLSEDSASQDLNVLPRTTNADGRATFAPECDEETEICDNPLWIGTENQPFTTAYRLVPVVTPPEEEEPPILTIASIASVEGAPSDPFDIWGDGCTGAGCEVNLTPGLSSSDTYTTTEDVGMGASEIGVGGTTINCPTQRVIFSSDLLFHATTGDEPVFLVSHITREDMKASTNNGQKHVGWCVGLKDNGGPWGFPQQDTNGTPGLQADDLYVGLAPKCPRRNAMNFAPCFVSKMGDDNGGSFISGWLPGGDPPRRT
jgi:hypothetical protein